MCRAAITPLPCMAVQLLQILQQLHRISCLFCALNCCKICNSCIRVHDFCLNFRRTKRRRRGILARFIAIITRPKNSTAGGLISCHVYDVYDSLLSGIYKHATPTAFRLCWMRRMAINIACLRRSNACESALNSSEVCLRNSRRSKSAACASESSCLRV